MHSNLIAKYPDRVPVIINSELVSKHKYLVPMDMNIGQFLFIVRNYIKDKTKAEEGYYLMTKNSMPNSSSSILDVYSRYKNEDLALYMDLKKESVFG